MRLILNLFRFEAGGVFVKLFATLIPTAGEFLRVGPSNKHVFALAHRVQAVTAETVIDNGLLITLLAEVDLIIHKCVVVLLYRIPS
jgi:hypothetical protein